MSLGMKKSLSIRTKFVLVFAFIFLFATTIPLALTLYLTFESLRESRRSEIEDKSFELHNAFDRGGLKMVKKVVELDTTLGLDSPYFARICTSEGNKTIFSSAPKGWKEFDFSRLSDIPLPKAGSILVLEAPDKAYTIELLHTTLDERYMLQVGGSTKMRDQVISSSLNTFGLVIIPSTILLLLIVWYLSSIMLRPVSDIVGVVREVIHTGRYDKKVPLRKSALEFEELIGLINRMFTKLDQLINNMKDTLQTVAHDIRTPMTRIQSRAEIAVKEIPNREETRRSLYSIIQESQTVSTLLQLILDASVAESGLVKIEEKEIDVALLCKEAAEVYEYVAEAKNVSIETDLPQSLSMKVDPDRMQQAVGNLLDNAVKYTAPGTTVKMSLQQNDENVDITVQDEGDGINIENTEDIWAPQFRAEKNENIKGYGLGLTIVKAVAETHGGTAHAHNSNEGSGAVFVVTLPYKRVISPTSKIT